MKTLTALSAGLLFGAGLLLSGMADPANVLAFLNITGEWNPALALTMSGAIAVAAPAFYLRRRRAGDAGGASSGRVAIRTSAGVDRPLLAGAANFGTGWGLSGICPGPGLLLLTALTPGAFVFVASMIAGMFLARRFPTRGP